ncbi:MAG TPA: AraC family transcriptional regulator [Spirochaetes bacterium]|nr:AraC family transcriptional regulator [Spirochaetota bacterium]
MKLNSLAYKSPKNPYWVEEKPDIAAPHPFETTYFTPKELGDGAFQSIQIRKGIALILLDQKPHHDLILEMVGSPELIKLNFTLSGQIKAKPAKANKYFIISSGERNVSVIQAKMHVELSKDQHTVATCVSIENSVIHSLTEGDEPLIPGNLSGMVKAYFNEAYKKPNPIHPSMSFILHQIHNCPYNGALKHIYLESKVLELLVLCIGQVSLSKRSGPAKRHQDIDKIHYAKEILINHMDDPPSLLELSRLVGLNDFKLKKGFREVLGTTVFGYLREKRMEKAHMLLKRGNTSVTEVTFEVGYQNPGYFAAEFKKQFGIYPSSLLNN